MLDNIAFWLVCLMGRVASAILCNFSTYIDSNGDPVRVDDVTVAPLHFKADVAPADNLTADIDFDPSQDEVFYLDESTLTTPSENDRWFELYDSATTSQIRIVWNSTRIAVFAVTPTTSVISGFDNSFILNQFQEIGFKLSGDGNNKSVVCVVDGVESTDVEFIDFT